MKISVRLPLFSVILTALAIIVCCVLLLVTTADNHINNAIQSGASELRMLNNSFAAELSVVGEGGLSDTAKRSLILYVFRKYTEASVSGSRYVLTDTAEPMFNDCPIDPRPLLPNLEQAAQSEDEAARWPYAIAELNGRRYLVVGHRKDMLADELQFAYEVFLVRDITDVYSGIAALGLRFGVIALITVFVSAVVMLLFIRRALRPLAALQNSAAALAESRYDSRIEVQGRDEIAALAESFNRMADAIAGHIQELQDTAQQRKLLLSALTHELKTPMTAIIGYSEALMRVNLSAEKRDASIQYIHSECRRLERLSQKMMQLIALHGGEPAHIRMRPVKALFDAVEMTLRGIAKKESIVLTMADYEHSIFAMDTDMMASVLINLFDNARKAGARHIAIEARDGVISVRDDGGGIPTDEIEKVTQPFYMVDQSHSQSEGGSGLGLALCDLIVRAHGAWLAIVSEMGVGTTVTINFDKLQFDDGSKMT